MVDLIGLRQHHGQWRIVAQTSPVVGFDWMKMRVALRDVTGPTLYEDWAGVFERNELLALATDLRAKAWICGAAGEAELFMVVFAENVESFCGD